MTITESLDIVIEKTGIERYRWLCSDANTNSLPNDPETWRRWIAYQAELITQGLPDISAHLVEALAQPEQVKPCGGCPGSV